MEPDVSAIIVSHNTVDLTIAAISHLVASAKRSDLAVETILVDNASTDGTPVAIHNRFPDVHLIALGRKLGVRRRKQSCDRNKLVRLIFSF